jgi:pilus assembly protein CpaB
MKRKIVLIISLVSGLLAAILMSAYLSAKERELMKEKAELRARYGGVISAVVFKSATPAGTEITRREIGLLDVPAAGMRGQALTEADIPKILGRRTVTSRQRGEVVFWSDIEDGKSGNGGLSADVKEGMRAISISCNLASSVSTMVKPNDHVDVIGTFNFPDGSGKVNKSDVVTSTILQNVLVLATGKNTSKSRALLGANQSSQNYSTVTLEVTPREAEMLVFVEQNKGKLVLTLRNRDDIDTEAQLPQIDYDVIRGQLETLNAERVKNAKSRNTIRGRR